MSLAEVQTMGYFTKIALAVAGLSCLLVGWLWITNRRGPVASYSVWLKATIGFSGAAIVALAASAFVSGDISHLYKISLPLVAILPAIMAHKQPNAPSK